MKYSELREKVRKHLKYPRCVELERSPLINPGFPGTFNLSLTEDFWLKEYGRFVDFDHDFIFSTVQSCIRPQDIDLLRTEHSWKYLGVFEMADLTGTINLAKKPDYSKLQKWQIKELIKFLEQIGISKERIHPSYCIGGKVKELTKGKYNFDFEIPEDRISKEAFLEAGVPEENLIQDRSRDTLLSLHIHRPTGWGYRNEVNVNVGEKENPVLVDVATLQYLLWKPKFNGIEIAKNICGLEEATDGVLVSGLGLERLCMVVNDLPSVRDVDYISPVYEAYNIIDESEDELIIESLRALHRVYSDITKFDITSSRHQKIKIRKILQNIPKELTEEQLKELLKVHSETQPWHSNLEDGIEPTIERIKVYRDS